MRAPRESHRRTVAGRLLASFFVVLAAFAVTVGWSVQALRAAARDAELLRAGYVPVLLRIGEALAEQNVFNAQLNHITAARNPGDVREWIETARRARPLTFAQVREAAERGLPPSGPSGQRELRDEVVREIAAIDKTLAQDPERFSRLFQALSVGDRDGAERARDELVRREADSAQRLRSVKARVEERMESLTALAKRREQQSMQLLVGLAALTLLVGVAMFIHARRVLAPLTAVTERAKAVGRGDLTPREVVATHDEIGELATTFEGMVAAIQRARAELVQAERLATIGKMAAHITHEIRNPLSSIGLNLELLEEEVARPPPAPSPGLGAAAPGAGQAAEGAQAAEAAALVAAIRKEVERLSRISEQYLSIARRPKPRLEVERIDDLVREVMAFVGPELERAGVASRVEVQGDVPEARVDEAQIRQALLNLVRNAREAMPRGGEIAVTVRQAVGGGVEITVEDTGTGIPDDVRASIFDPFFTTKARGTGLGLAVTREIIEAHDGVIACEARDPHGTRLRIHLPAID